MAWEPEFEGWTTREEAEAAAKAAREADPTSEACVLFLHNGYVWDDDPTEAEGFQVADGSGAFQLFPPEAIDELQDELDDTDFVAPSGFVWVYVA